MTTYPETAVFEQIEALAKDEEFEFLRQRAEQALFAAFNFSPDELLSKPCNSLVLSPVRGMDEQA